MVGRLRSQAPPVAWIVPLAADTEGGWSKPQHEWLMQLSRNAGRCPLDTSVHRRARDYKMRHKPGIFAAMTLSDAEVRRFPFWLAGTWVAVPAVPSRATVCRRTHYVDAGRRATCSSRISRVVSRAS